MKRHFKTASSLIAAVFLLCTFTLPGGAAALQKDKAANYISTQTDGYTVKQSVSPQNYQAMQSSLTKQGLSKREVNRQILEETDFVKEGSASFERVLDAMEDGDAIETITQYIKVTPSGQEIRMTKDAFEQDAAEEMIKRSAQVRAPSQDIGGTEEPPSSYNGYVRMAISYIRNIREGNQYFYLSLGLLEWVIMPVTRMTDAMSFYSDSLVWSDKNSNQYKDYWLVWEADYKETDAGYINYGKEYTETDAHKVEKNPGGFYFSFRLPSTISYLNYTKTYTRFQIIISGWGELKNNNINTFELFLQYAHKKIGISTEASFSWSTGVNPGVVFSFSIIPELQTTYYRLTKKVA